MQFAGQGRFGIRPETVSNAYLCGDDRLSSGAERLLVALGWNRPTMTPAEDQAEGAVDGSPNWFLDVAWPVPFDEVAALATRTLR